MARLPGHRHRRPEPVGLLPRRRRARTSSSRTCTQRASRSSSTTTRGTPAPDGPATTPPSWPRWWPISRSTGSSSTPSRRAGPSCSTGSPPPGPVSPSRASRRWRWSGSADHPLSWAQWFADSPTPGVVRSHWFERRHQMHHVRRWHRDHAEELQSAWLNGVGVMVWEVVFGVWVGWSDRDAQALRRMSGAQRALHHLFVEGEWTPLVDLGESVCAAGVFGSTFTSRTEQVMTLVNRSATDAAVRSRFPATAPHTTSGPAGGWRPETGRSSRRSRLAGSAASGRRRRTQDASWLPADPPVEVVGRRSRTAGPRVRVARASRAAVPPTTWSLAGRARADRAVPEPGDRDVRRRSVHRRVEATDPTAARPPYGPASGPRPAPGRGRGSRGDGGRVRAVRRGHRPPAGVPRRPGPGLAGPLHPRATQDRPVTEVDLADARAYAALGRRPAADRGRVAAGRRPARFRAARAGGLEPHRERAQRRADAVPHAQGRLGAPGEGSAWYFDGGVRSPEFAAKYLVPGQGLGRSAQVGFRLAWDLRSERSA